MSTTKRASYSQAAQILAARDPVLAQLIEDAGPMRLSRARLSPFGALVQAIVYQQLAGAAARAIHGRLVDDARRGDPGRRVAQDIRASSRDRAAEVPRKFPSGD